MVVAEEVKETMHQKHSQLLLQGVPPFLSLPRGCVQRDQDVPQDLDWQLWARLGGGVGDGQRVSAGDGWQNHVVLALGQLLSTRREGSTEQCLGQGLYDEVCTRH